MLLLALPVLIYVIISLSGVERKISQIAETELTNLLGARVTIASADIMPFNRVTLNDVAVAVAPGDTALSVRKIGAGIRLDRLLFRQEIVVSYVELLAPEFRMVKDSVNGPLNIEPIIRKLSGNGDNKKRPFNLEISSVVIRRGTLSFDVLSDTVQPTTGRVCPGHINLTDFKADVKLPRISDKGTEITLKRLSLEEQSGFRIASMTANVSITDSGITASGMSIDLNNSLIEIDSLSVTHTPGSKLITPESCVMFHLTPGSYISSGDLAYFVSLPENMNHIELPVSAYAKGRLNNLHIDRLIVGDTHSIARLSIDNANVHIMTDKDSTSVEIPQIDAQINFPEIADLFIKEKVAISHLDSIGTVSLTGNTILRSSGLSNARMQIRTGYGKAEINTSFNGNLTDVSGLSNTRIVAQELNLSQLTGNINFGTLSAAIETKAVFGQKQLQSAKADIRVGKLGFKGYDYSNITAECNHNVEKSGLKLNVDDPNATLVTNVELRHRRNEKKQLNYNLRINSINPYALNLTSAYKGYRAAASAIGSANFDNIDNLDGKFEIYNFSFTDESDNGVELNYLMAMLSGSTTPQYALLHSDIADANLSGAYKISQLKQAFMQCFSPVFPSLKLAPDNLSAGCDSTNLKLNLDLRSNQTMSKWLTFFKSPVDIVHQINVTASLDQKQKHLQTQIKAPCLLKKDKFIDSTFISASIDGSVGHGTLNATTKMPTKQGPATISVSVDAENDSLNFETNWLIENQRRFAGLINADIRLSETDAGQMAVLTRINPSQIAVNDTVWNVHPANINIVDKNIEIKDFNITGSGQFIKINGVVSPNPFDELSLELLDIDLDYIFETLGIGNAMFGGRATGKFFASRLLSKEPSIATPSLHVDGFKYNFATLGDADIESYWEPESRGIVIKADIVGDSGKHSFVDGAIYPLADSLDIEFKADNLNVGFMKPFMSAFTSDVTGRASGYAHLFGTFKNINLSGDILAQNLRLKLDFTNTYYHTTDSVHIKPGMIELNNIHLNDDYNNGALLNGWVSHDYFRKPKFEFRITDARQLLCFDVNSQINPDWYGRIFCNGNATIKGIPGLIDMNIDISTAPKSVFSFALNDNVTADEYTFLQFNDRHKADTDLLMAIENPEDASVKRIKDRFRQQKMLQNVETSSIYKINLQLDATPDGEMNLIMDPVSGDRIRARGNGNLRIEYVSTDDDMKMFGTYTLEQGTYNFTLQDIIIKDFTITPGSSITFRGDPLAAQLDIKAAFPLNANLSDLDESFMQDKELNRTNVPVQALLMVDGDMRQPDISFDLRFPTLSQDIYRKVKSIVSTPEMMNRQIIYLLALNRFYTPDYMASTTRGNELMSVASSTISSQLSNILGQISDKWTISPNFRSSKGDFSDMEVDLALSSHLLNNRLLFNGNFGYRDKSLNNNTFIGDFDIEYLLNRSGNIRLKAYNRYNDQNYFVRSALTTQGVGVVFKREFDNMFNFLKPWNKKTVYQTDSTTTQPADTTDTEKLLELKKRTPINP